MEIVSDRIKRAVKYFKHIEGLARKPTDQTAGHRVTAEISGNTAKKEERRLTRKTELSEDQLDALREAAEKFEKAAVENMKLKFEERIKPLQESVEAIKGVR